MANTTKDVTEENTPHSKEFYYGLLHEKLSQTTPLSRDELRQVQDALTNINIDAGPKDGWAGTKTSTGIVAFLKTDAAEGLASQLGEHVKDTLVIYGKGAELDIVVAQENISDFDHAKLKFDIGSYLQKDNITRDERHNLQENLNELKYNSGNSDGIMGNKTASGMMGYLKDNPEELLNVSITSLREMMNSGQTADLRELAQKVEGFDERIGQRLEDIGDIDKANWNDVYAAQTLLDLGGYKPGGIDGVAGSRTNAGINRFNTANTAVTPTIVESFNDVVEQGDIIVPTSVEPIAVAPKQPAIVPQEDTLSPTTKYGTNGYGVSTIDYENAWSSITGEDRLEHSGEGKISASDNPRPLIMIDPGHGYINVNDKLDQGKDPAHVHNMHEMDIIDPIALALAEELHSFGFQVAFTRNPGEELRVEHDYNESLSVRPELAHSVEKETGANGKLYFSIHANADSDQSADGTRIYVQGSNGKAVNDSSQALAQSIANNFSISDKGTALHQADYSVLRNFENGVDENSKNLNASVLIETGFITNKKDAVALDELRKNPDEAAFQIATAINDFVVKNTPELQLAASTKIESTLDDDKEIELASSNGQTIEVASTQTPTL